MPADLKELRRLHEAAVEWAGTQTALREREEARAEVIRTLPSLLDRLEAAEAENARLRRGLDHVEQMTHGVLCKYCEQVNEMAREALEGEVKRS